MKKTIVALGFLLFGYNVLADTLTNAAQSVHSSSQGKLIQVWSTVIYAADGSTVSVESSNTPTTANMVCDFKQPWSAAGAQSLFCFAK